MKEFHIVEERKSERSWKEEIKVASTRVSLKEMGQMDGGMVDVCKYKKEGRETRWHLGSLGLLHLFFAHEDKFLVRLELDTCKPKLM